MSDIMNKMLHETTSKFRADGTKYMTECRCGSWWKVYQNEIHNGDDSECFSCPHSLEGHGFDKTGCNGDNRGNCGCDGFIFTSYNTKNHDVG